MNFAPALSYQVVIAFGLIALNACFVLTEFAIVKVRSSRLEILARQGNPRALLVQSILRDLDVYLSAIQMGITMTSLGVGWVGEPAVAQVLEGLLRRISYPYHDILTHGISFVLAFGIITFLHILLGELVPRFIGLQKSETVVLWAAYPLRLFYLCFKMPVTLLTGASRLILRLIRMPPVIDNEFHLSEEEFRILLGTSEDKGVFSLQRLMLIENIFDFGAAKVSDAMLAKDKAAFLCLTKPWEENLSMIRSKRFSRYPLCKTDLDSSVGYIHIKDLTLHPETRIQEPDLTLHRRDLPVVAPGDSLQKLMQTFADKGAHIALVRDAQGQAVGVVTLEDILEELVGEVHDEFDMPLAWSLMDILVPNGVEIELGAGNEQAAIRRLISRIKASHPPLDQGEATRIVLEREAKLSSAVGHGLAIPHGRLQNLERPLMAIGLSTRSLPFQSPDKMPVRLVFLVLTPSSTPLMQLKILARIAALVSNENLHRRLLRAKNAEHLVEILRAADTVLAS